MPQCNSEPPCPLAHSSVHICGSLELEGSHIEELLLVVFEMRLAPEPSSPALASVPSSLEFGI